MLRRGSPLPEHVDERLVHVTQRCARSLGGLPSAQIGLLALLVIAAVSGGLLLSADPRLRTSSRSPRNTSDVTQAGHTVNDSKFHQLISSKFLQTLE